MRRQTGLTLIELLVTLAIMGVLVGVVFPGFQQMMARNNLATTANSLVLALSYARAEATREGGGIRVAPRDGDDSDGPGGNDWSLGWAVYSVNEPPVTGADIRQVFEGPTGDLTLAANVNMIEFSSQGLVAATDPLSGTEPLVPVTLDLCLAGVEGVRVAVSAVGRPGTSELTAGDCP